MIMSVMSALSLLRTIERFNKLAPPVVQAGPVGKEIQAVKELQSRVGHLMFNEHSKGASTMLRWLRANKMDVDGAEKMLRAHIKWRKDLNINKLRHQEPDPKILKRFWYNITGFARNENPVMLLTFGEWDIKGYIDAGGTRNKFDMFMGQMWEKALWAVEKVESKPKPKRKDNSPVQYIIVSDLKGFAYRQLASSQSLQFILSMVINFESNYPEVISHYYIINADWVFEILLRIIRPLMTRSIEKLRVLGADRSKWEKVLRKQIDPKILPHRFGGYSKKEIER